MPMQTLPKTLPAAPGVFATLCAHWLRIVGLPWAPLLGLLVVNWAEQHLSVASKIATPAVLTIAACYGVLATWIMYHLCHNLECARARLKRVQASA